MNKGWIVWIVLVIIVAVVAYVYTGFNISPHKNTVSTTITSTALSTTQSTVPTTSIIQNTTLPNCANLIVQDINFNSNATAPCEWEGGKIGVWVKAGNAASASVMITGADNTTYLQGSFTYNCTAFYRNVTLPAQNYTVTLTTGPGVGSCGSPQVILNLTTTAPLEVYPYIYNANFSTGTFTGWNASGAGFGSAPVNITYLNDSSCYYGEPWSNYKGMYFATTYNCGTGIAPGNLTSSPFRVNPKTPFLNFQIVSPEDNLIYVEILKVSQTGSQIGNATPEIIAQFDTFNISEGPQINTEFSNVSIPLTTLVGKGIEIRVVADTLQSDRYMAIGGFSLSNLPNQDSWVSSSIQLVR